MAAISSSLALTAASFSCLCPRRAALSFLSPSMSFWIRAMFAPRLSKVAFSLSLSL